MAIEPKRIKVFLSSTFCNLQDERDMIMGRLFPYNSPKILDNLQN